MINKLKYFLLLTVFMSAELLGQSASLDYGLINVGNIRLTVTNRGGLNAKMDNAFTFPGLINMEHPPNSGVEHITNSGLWIGGVRDGKRSVVEAEIHGGLRECYPTSEPWDTVWEVKKREVVDIPYWPGYTGVSDQDFVCRYNDYGPVSQRVEDHYPLYLEIIQVTHAWASPPLDETIVVNYYITPKYQTVYDIFLGQYMNGNVGRVDAEGYALDDETYYIRGENMMIARDVEGGPDGNPSWVAEKFYPPGNPDVTTFVWWNGVKQSPPGDDNDKYVMMNGNEIQVEQISTGDGTKSMVAFGKYDSLAVGDTLHLVMALMVGYDENELKSKASYLTQIKSRDYKVPSPPPSPELTVTSENNSVVIDWTPVPGGTNPEEFTDPDRADGNNKPFEGYRIYKSTESADGPWTLLNQYDIVNDYDINTGLEYTYRDEGLLNNIEYYYTVTSYTLPDNTINFPELESSKTIGTVVAVPGTPPPKTVGKVEVVPNPYRGDVAYHTYNPPWEKPPSGREWLEQDRRLQFINLPERCQIKIFTLAGDLIYTIDHDNPTRGYEDWNLTSSVGQAISSGIYLFTVEDPATGEVQVGKFVIIK